MVERGVIVSHPAIRMWAEKFGQHVGADIPRGSTGHFDGKWHLDAVVITTRGKTHWLWRAVGQDEFVLEVLGQSRSNTTASMRLIRKPLKRQG